MEANPTITGLGQIGVVLRGEPERMMQWVQQWSTRRVVLQVGVIFLGAGLYGASMGYWREPLQGLFVAIKFPMIILLTTLGNGLLNGMLAPLLGLNLSFRQSFQAILMSFTIATAILGSFSPIVFFLVWNAPAMSAHVPGVYSFIQLIHVVLIAFAGVTANLRLVELLQRLSGSVGIGRKVLFAWLAGNLFLGSQLCWILRPFIGAPGLPVEFLRAEAFKGNFFETVFRAIQNLFFS
ncbi:MAG: hypothetical protein JWQ71_2685 [Pedosphaera sp.]|nr:hypothetical protein [Pedosphaera sp.]